MKAFLHANHISSRELYFLKREREVLDKKLVSHQEPLDFFGEGMLSAFLEELAEL